MPKKPESSDTKNDEPEILISNWNSRPIVETRSGGRLVIHCWHWDICVGGRIAQWSERAIRVLVGKK